MYHKNNKLESVEVVESTAVPTSTHSSYLRELRHTILLVGLLILCLVVLIGFLTGMLSAWHEYVAAWGIVWQFIAWGIMVGVPATVFVLLVRATIHSVVTFLHQYQDMTESIKERRAAREQMVKQSDAEIERIQAEAAEIRARAKQMQFSLPIDERGNLVYHNPYTNQISLVTGNYQEYPNLSSLHYSIKQDGVQQQALPTPTVGAKPTIAELTKLVERNSLQVPLGRSLKNGGEPCIVDVSDVHLKIIGTSQKGKSCLAGAIIDITTQTHDTDVLQVAILDMENKTGKLFESLSHIAVLTIAGRQVTLHARNPKQVADYLHLIRELMDYRYSLTETQQDALPHILVYVEEFLSLKRHNSLSTQIRARLVDDLNELAIRGLKARIHLMCCAQVDYVDDELKAFANNFGLNISFSVRPEAARAAGMVCHELLAENYRNKLKGQFVVEGTGCTDLCDAPDYDVKARLKELNEMNVDRADLGSQEENLSGECGLNVDGTQVRTWIESASEATLNQKVGEVLEAMQSGVNTKDALIDLVWHAKKGKGRDYQDACAQYEQVMKLIAQRAMRSQ
jgi:hypothetical protein